MSIWNRLTGHEPQIAWFRGLVAGGRLAHAFLFLGPSGVGKQTFARLLAQCLMCERFAETALDACGQCAGCKQVEANSHPDLFLVGRPEGKREIPIETFVGPPERRGKAGLCYELAHTPMAGGRKIAIIDDADALNDESANALLKTLEEPPPRSLLILIATNADGILPTIRSRCQLVRFAPLSARQVQELLVSQGFCDDPAHAAEAAALSGGSLTEAAELLAPEFGELRGRLQAALGEYPFNGLKFSQAFLDGLESLAADTAGQRLVAGRLLRSTVETLRSLLREVGGAAADPSSPTPPGAAALISRYASNSNDSLDLLAAQIERCLLAQWQIDQNASLPLVLESLGDDLSRLQRGLPAVLELTAR